MTHTIVAVGVSILNMEPTPISINGKFSVDSGTAVSSFPCASFPSHLRVGFGLLFTDQLGHGGRSREEGRNDLESKW